MGNPGSKFEQYKRNEKKSVSTPAVATPPRYLELDPRSPSTNISRTPIEHILNTPTVKETVLDEEFFEANDNLGSEKNLKCKVLDIDPRSPTTEFIRTPIVVEATPNGKVKIHNKNLDNVRKQLGLFNLTKVETKNFSKTTSNNTLEITEKTDSLGNVQKKTKRDAVKKLYRPKSICALPSMQDISGKIRNENKRRSVAGLLETNLDFIETNLDEVYQKKMSPMKIRSLSSSPTKISTTVTAIAREDVENKVSDKEIQTDLDLNIIEEKRSVKEVQTDFELQDLHNFDKNDDQICAKLSQTEEKLLKEDNLTKDEEVLDNVSEVLYKEMYLKQKYDAISPIVEEFDKKLTNLIYEDRIQDDFRIIKQKENNRTPLGVRNSNDHPIRSKLRVSDKPTKHQIGSKIPVPKDKKIIDKVHKFNFQCENTPPGSLDFSHNIVKPKPTKWDADKTLII